MGVTCFNNETNLGIKQQSKPVSILCADATIRANSTFPYFEKVLDGLNFSTKTRMFLLRVLWS